MEWKIDLGGLAALILAAIALYKAYRTTPHDIHSLDASAVEKYAGASATVASMNINLQSRVETLELKVDDLEITVKRKDQQIESWRQGIEILIKQLIDIGQEPKWRPANGNKSSGS